MQKIVSYGKIVFFVIAWVFVGIFLYKNWFSLTALLSVRNWFYFVLSFLFLLPAYYALYLARKNLINAFHMKIPEHRQWSIFAHSMITRYIPGGIWNHVDSALQMREHGAPVKQTGKLVFLELYWRTVFGYIFFGIIIFTSDAARSLFGVFGYVLFLISLVIIGVVTVGVGYIKPRFRLNSWRVLGEQSIFELFYYVFTGLSFVFLVAAFQNFNFSLLSIYYVIAASAIGWIAGFLFLPAPSGLGIREVVMAYFLSGIGPIFAVGFSLVLLSRIVMLVRDVAIYTGSLLLTKLHK
ncbi:MAG: hypothetical protein WC775_06150 [Patescibacteria group bacterium]|jgi:hypothetical protein